MCVCVGRSHGSDINERIQADVELDAYKDNLGDFGSELAQWTIFSRNPGIMFLKLTILIIS